MPPHGNSSDNVEPQLQTFNQNNWIPQQLSAPEQQRPLLPQTSTTIHTDYPPHPNHLSHTRGRHITEITHGIGSGGGGGDSSDSGVCGGASARPRIVGGGDAMTAIIADSSTPTATSSSSDGRRSSSSATPPSARQDALPSSGDQPQQAQQQRQRSASDDIQPYQVLPYDDKKMNPNPPSTVNDCGGGSASTIVKSSSMAESLCDTGFGVVNSGGIAKFSGRGSGFDSDSGIVGTRVVTVKEMSPMVFKDTVTTGGYR